MDGVDRGAIGRRRGSPARRPGRTRLRYQPLWQWVGLVVLAIGLTLGWLLAVSGTNLPCH
jgi:hypothetical protein